MNFITPLTPPIIPQEFPVKLKETISAVSLWDKIKYRYFVSPFTYVFTENYRIKIGDKNFLDIIKGYELDLSSVPPFLWWLLPPITKGADGTFAHDWIYSEDIFRELMGWFLNKIWGDWVMLKLRKGKVPWWDNWIRFIGVLIFGWIVYFRKKKKVELDDISVV